jgi:hypothetical protein
VGSSENLEGVWLALNGLMAGALSDAGPGSHSRACLAQPQSASVTKMSTHGIRIRADRVTLSVSPEQLEWLNGLARRYGVSVSDILRRLIDETRGAYLTPCDARSSRETGHQREAA